MRTRFFLGGIVEDDANDDALGDKPGRQTDDIDVQVCFWKSRRPV
jgi:hypothetical protein